MASGRWGLVEWWVESSGRGQHLGPIRVSYRAKLRRANEHDTIDRRRPSCRHRLIDWHRLFAGKIWSDWQDKGDCLEWLGQKTGHRRLVQESSPLSPTFRSEMRPEQSVWLRSGGARNKGEGGIWAALNIPKRLNFLRAMQTNEKYFSLLITNECSHQIPRLKDRISPGNNDASVALN